jgi:hypothetical protein
VLVKERLLIDKAVPESTANLLTLWAFLAQHLWS